MRTKVQSKKRNTLPKKLDRESVVLRSLRKSRADEVRAKLVELGINERDVADAVKWARKST